MESCPTGSVVISLTGQIVYVNLQAAHLFGVKRSILNGTSLRMMFSQPERFDQLLSVFKSRGALKDIEVNLRHLGAKDFWAEMSWDETRFNDQPSVMIWIRDVSVQKLSEETLEKLFNAAPLPMMLCSFPDGVVRRSNRRANELFVAGSQQTTFRVENIMVKKIWQNFSNRLRGGGFIDDFEVFLNTAYGESYYSMLSGQLVEVDGENCILVGASDITDRKHAEDTMLRFFDGAPLVMILARISDGQILRINRRASELFDPRGVKNTRYLDGFMGPVARTLFIDKLGGGGFIDNFEAQLITDYGEGFWAILSGQVLEIDDERCVLIGVTDISDRKWGEDELRAAKEEAERATKAKSLFLATMSHEIRTPMNGVLGMLDMLASSSLSEDQEEMVRVIGDSARTLLTIIDDILDVSKIESGKMHMERVSMQLCELIEGSLELMSSRARDKNIEMVWVLDDSLPSAVFGDPVRLRQILLNLLGNAIKFTPSGYVALKVSLTGSEDKFISVRFEVEDTGIGLTEEQQGKMFQPFSQADASTTRRFGGTGLGLSICRRLVAMMGGDIGVISSEGRGSTFWFEIPLETDVAAKPKHKESFQDISVLVVDDLEITRENIAGILTKFGAQVHLAASQTEAFKLLGQGILVQVALIDEELISQELMTELMRTLPPEKIIPMSMKTGSSDGSPKLIKPVHSSRILQILNHVHGRIDENDEVRLPKIDGSIAPPSIEEALRTGCLILVAEDNPTNRLVVGKQLGRLGYAFEMVEDGEAAWDALQRKQYALLLTDCFMPKLDGYLLTGRIRSDEAGTQRRLPIIALTASALSDDAEKCLRSGMDDYLSKPVDIKKLGALLKKWMPITSVEVEKAYEVEEKPKENGDIIDRSALTNILGCDDPQLFAEILGFFIESFEDLNQRLQAAVVAKDRVELRNAAHAAKGAAQNAAATKLAETLTSLEHGAAKATLKTLRTLVSDTQVRFAAVRNYVKSLSSTPAEN